MHKLFKQVVSNMKREKFLAISNIMVMSVTFLLLGVFIYVIAISQTALRYLEQQVQLSVFFKDDFAEKNILEMKSKLEADGRVSAIKYVSKDDAFKIFSEINKNEPILLESISPSILPASLEVKAYNLSDLPALSEQLSSTEGVEEVRFFKDVIQKFKQWSSAVYIVGFLLVAAFIIISYSVVINTLRTTINSKGVEVEIMKLVGASDRYVKNPLIMQGVTFGAVSGAIAGLILLVAGVVMHKFDSMGAGFTFGFLPTLYIKPIAFAVILFFILLASGVTLGYVGSVTAVKRYLKY